MRRINLFFWILPSLLSSSVFSTTVNKSTVLVCYGKLDASSIKGYNYVVLEEKHYNKEDIKIIKKNNKQVLAYISLGEVNSNAPHYHLLKDNTLGKNENWDSYYLDLKSAKTKLVLMRLAKKCLDKGFNGLLLDNIDNFTSFGPQKKQQKELIFLIESIKKQHPSSTLIQNAGAEIIPLTHAYVDGILFESVATNFSFTDRVYKLREQKDFDSYLKRIYDIKLKYNKPILLVEYADTQTLYADINKRLASKKLEYFIGTIDLQKIPIYSSTKS